MKGGNLVQILGGTLNPNTTNSSYETLFSMRSNNNFVVDLLIICDDNNCDINIRQSAIIYLKNTIEENFKGKPFIPEGDIETIKASLLEGMKYQIKLL